MTENYIGRTKQRFLFRREVHITNYQKRFVTDDL